MSLFDFKFPKKGVSRFLFVASVLLGIVVVVVFCLESRSSYLSELKSAEKQAHNLSKVLEEQIVSTFQKVDLVLQDVQDGFEQTNGFHYHHGKIKDYLEEHRKRVPEVHSLKFFGPDGQLLFSDREDRGMFLISDRDFFQFYKKEKKNVLKITPPLKGRGGGSWIVVLTRPIFDDQLNFKGVIAASIPVELIQRVLAKINIGSKGSITLFGFDSIVYARAPHLPEYMGKKISLEAPTVQLINSDKEVSSYQSVSKLDGYEKMYSIRKIKNLPMLLAVGLSVQEILNSWKSRTRIYVMILLVVFVSFSSILLMYIRSIENFEEQRKLAIQSAKLTTLGEMASNIAHEINNPLTVISTMAMVTKFPDARDDREMKFNNNLDKIIQTVERIAKIIQSLRTFSRDSYDDPILPTSIQSILNTTFELCLQRLKNNMISVEIVPFEDKLINCREYQIVQVLMNLLNNALDALDGVKEKKIIVKVEEKEQVMRLMVQDNGPKIPDEVVEKMMNPFYTTKEMGKGTGLGLSISKGIIENHKGAFYYERIDGLTTFVIELPKSVLG